MTSASTLMRGTPAMRHNRGAMIINRRLFRRVGVVLDRCTSLFEGDEY
jgi:hypothetical protein